MKKGDDLFLKHPLVQQMFNNNKEFYKSIQDNNYPIERLVSRPNRTPADVINLVYLAIRGK